MGEYYKNLLVSLLIYWNLSTKQTKFFKTGPYFSAEFLALKSRWVPYPCLTSARTRLQNMKSRRILANQGEVVSLALPQIRLHGLFVYNSRQNTSCNLIWICNQWVIDECFYANQSLSHNLGSINNSFIVKINQHEWVGGNQTRFVRIILFE